MGRDVHMGSANRMVIRLSYSRAVVCLFLFPLVGDCRKATTPGARALDDSTAVPMVHVIATSRPDSLTLVVSNTMADTIFVGRCGQQPAAVVERQVDNGWRVVIGDFCSYVAAPPTPVPPGAEMEVMPLTLPIGQPPKSVYRAIVSVYVTRVGGYRGIAADLLPIESRQSTTFTFKGPP